MAELTLSLYDAIYALLIYLTIQISLPAHKQVVSKANNVTRETNLFKWIGSFMELQTGIRNEKVSCFSLNVVY